MLFNSWIFPVFFVLTFAAYWLLHRRLSLQNLLVLVASYVFYGWWDVRFLSLIVISTAIDFATAQVIDNGRLSAKHRWWLASFVTISSGAFLFALGRQWFLQSGCWILLGITGVCALLLATYPLLVRLQPTTRRRVALCVSLAGNLGMLALFKYFDFFASGFAELWQALTGSPAGDLTLNLILPVGISFYTFQTMSYTIDVYRGTMRSTKDPVAFASYVAFFPQLVAGPIERASHLLPQFLRTRTFPDRDQLASGLWLIAWGFYKKLVVADNVAHIVNSVFGPYDITPTLEGRTDGVTFLIAIYAFAIQIYCDFSGYTDIARGVARLLGFDIMLNFNLPYFASSPSDFWRRWHISLSTWLRDYLYIPLGGSRLGSARTYCNLMITMVLGGLWHGAAWTFVVWGVYHGAILGVFRYFERSPLVQAVRARGWRVPKVIAALIMFHLTCVGWLLFRARNMETVWVFARDIVSSPFLSDTSWSLSRELVQYSWFLVLFQCVQARLGLDPLGKLHWFVRLNIWVFVLVCILRLSAPGGQEFIYFAF